jgi:integrase
MMAARPGPLRGHGPPAGACVGHLTKTAPDRLHHSIVVSLLTGARAQELRALRWDNVHLDGNPDARPPIPPHIEVWRSVRRGGDTKTRKSRRTLALPARCIEAPRKQRAQQAADRLAAGDWQDSGLVFTTVFPCHAGETRGSRSTRGRAAVRERIVGARKRMGR